MEKTDLTMDFEGFIEFMREKVQICLGARASVEHKTVLKGNGMKLQALQISQDTMILCPVIYLERYYEDYKEGKPVATCVKEVCDVFMNNQFEQQEAEALVESIKSWEMSRRVVHPILLPYEGNEELLENLVHRKYLDLALCYSLCLEHETNGNMTVRVSRGLLETWGISEEELYAQAFDNMKYAGYHIMSIREVLSNMGMSCCLEEEIDDCSFSVLTNRRKLYGAAGILNTDLLETFSEKVKQNLFLLPSSLHEMIIIPDDGKMNAQEYAEMITDVNGTMVRKEEWLADHAYYFDREKGEVRMAG